MIGRSECFISKANPRWEYRYLKNMLIREKSIDASAFLISADKAFAQEGDTPISRLPQGPEEWRRYDVVVLGDVPAEALSADQRKDLHDLVSQRGAGLLWIGGAAVHATQLRGDAAGGPPADARPRRGKRACRGARWRLGRRRWRRA